MGTRAELERGVRRRWVCTRRYLHAGPNRSVIFNCLTQPTPLIVLTGCIARYSVEGVSLPSPRQLL
jgi:hypothetical protein